MPSLWAHFTFPALTTELWTAPESLLLGCKYIKRSFFTHLEVQNIYSVGLPIDLIALNSMCTHTRVLCFYNIIYLIKFTLPKLQHHARTLAHQSVHESFANVSEPGQQRKKIYSVFIQTCSCICIAGRASHEHSDHTYNLAKIEKRNNQKQPWKCIAC